MGDGDRDDNKKMKKFVIYTAIFGQKCNWKRPVYSDSTIDRFLYTDLGITNNMYQMKRIKLGHLDSVRRNRFIKICIPDEIFNNYEYSFYMDYKHPVAIDFNYLLNSLMPDSDILITPHRKRDCVYDEGMACIKGGENKKEIILKQLDFYKHKNYPTCNGLYAAYWLFRLHTKK